MLYHIITDFKGSQDGRFSEDFKAGTQAELSDYLAGIVVPEGWAEPVEEAAAPVEIDNKAIATDGDKPAMRRGKSK